MTIAVTTLLIHAKDMQRSVRFYADHFDYVTSYAVVDGLILSFSVPDVDQFVATVAAAGLDLGTVHRVRGYAFANTQDPDGDSISVSSRQHHA